MAPAGGVFPGWSSSRHRFGEDHSCVDFPAHKRKRIISFFGGRLTMDKFHFESEAKCNVSLTRNSCASTAGLSQPSLSLPRTAAPPQVLASNSTSVALHIVPDQNWLSIWRIALPDGRSSGMLNLTRAKDDHVTLTPGAAALAVATDTLWVPFGHKANLAHSTG